LAESASLIDIQKSFKGSRTKTLAYTKLIEAGEVLKKSRDLSVKFLPASLPSIFISLLSEQIKSPLLIFCDDAKSAKSLYSDLAQQFDENKLSLLVEPQKSVKSVLDDHEGLLGWLVEGLSVLLKYDNSIAIATPDILSIKVPTSDSLVKSYISIKKGETLNFQDFTTKLQLEGFEKSDYVEKEGQIAVRGGILDIFPTAARNPLRIEFWGNEVESIREFDINSQRSVTEHDKIEFLGKLFHEDNTEQETDIYEYLTENTVIAELEPDRFHDIPENWKKPGFTYLTINPLAQASLNITASPQRTFDADIDEMTTELQKLTAFGYKVHLCADGSIHRDRFREMVEESLKTKTQDLEDPELASPEDTIKLLKWHPYTLSEGFVCEDAKLAVFTEHQVFSRMRITERSKKAQSKKKGISLAELQVLNIGDYVVHDDKGVARFNGFKTVNLGGSDQDCVQLEFQGGDRLFVNMNYIHKIQKYSAAEGIPPKMSKLGSTEWVRKKARTKKKIKDIARDLIKLYAKRKMQTGFQFPDDNKWQREFEASFVYEDTEDQAKATDEIKVDMQSETPMDRLVCGDVGFGKTEVAIRAAFKAVQSGKQVAVLVPTTVLAQQHYMSFRDRLHRYPVKVDVISRFRSTKDQKGILEDLEGGKTDIIIGTHRLLSKDIKFSDLGLLIVDEEQRFGVAAKEKLREMRVSIDTLTLTATPIPRTLNFSLMGARDLSVIETPPRNRLPVATEIAEWDDELVVGAIEKELDRNGQVFFVSDRVEDLEKIQMDLKMMLPNVKFGIAHGQMTGTQLEKAMQGFISGKVDVLVTTKIVESGLDIPNANTMIINRANNFGLAELYQLRGRVGRSNHQAYCYLLIDQKKKITPQAMKRLQAIEEFTDLGSGFQLALRDMEIRGAGNLLGGEQSGMIYDIGFDLYQKVLDEAVQELKHEEFGELFGGSGRSLAEAITNEEIAIELDKDALIPEDYITDDTNRFKIYKRLYSVKDKIKLNELVDELKDTYGKLPEQFVNLLMAIEIRMASLKTGFERVIVKQHKLICEFPPKDKEIYYEHALPVVLDFIQDLDNAKMSQGKTRLMVEIPIEGYGEAIELLWKIKRNIELVDDLAL
jgi:transcription-repair coupling factor (superfamily II helicase)